VFGPLGITICAFQDPKGSKRVGMIVEIPGAGGVRGAEPSTEQSSEAREREEGERSSLT
jgi:hypothetical protein